MSQQTTTNTNQDVEKQLNIDEGEVEQDVSLWLEAILYVSLVMQVAGFGALFWIMVQMIQAYFRVMVSTSARSEWCVCIVD